MNIDQEFVKQVETAHFRTDQDTGATLNSLFIWNMVRNHVGLPRLQLTDLPAWCTVHRKYHVIQEDYGCQREKLKERI